MKTVIHSLHFPYFVNFEFSFVCNFKRFIKDKIFSVEYIRHKQYN